MNNPKIAELLSHAAKLGVKEEEARPLFKKHNIKTFRKLERVIGNGPARVVLDPRGLATVAGDRRSRTKATGTLTLVAGDKCWTRKVQQSSWKHVLPTQVRSIDQAKANAVIRAAKKRLTLLRGDSVNSPGPRGFRIGAVWLKSITEGKGPALSPTNLPKLVATAAAKGVKLPSRQLTQKELVSHIANKL